MKSNEFILAKQINAYNERDIDFMVKQLHPEFQWVSVMSDTTIIEAHNQTEFKSRMEAFFNKVPSVNLEILGFTIEDDKITTVEEVSFDDNGQIIFQNVIVTYEFKDNLIYRQWYY